MWKNNPLKEKKNTVILLLGILCLIRTTQAPTRLLVWVAVGVLLCSFADYLINSLFLKKSIVPQSAIISGFIVSGIIDYRQPWVVLVVFCLLAIISKHIIKIRRAHIFNPANFALFMASLFKIPLTWSIESNIYLIIIVGLYLAYSYKKIAHVLGYLIAFGFLFSILMKGNPLLIVSWFFVFIMLIEPKTSGYGTGKGFIFGAIAGIASACFLKFFPQYDFYVGSLFLANLSRPLIEKVKK